MGWLDQGPVRLGILLFLSFALSNARECRINCHGSSGNLLRFEPGKVYNYKLAGQSISVVTGAPGEASKLGISADVQIAVLSSCEHALKVTNVQTTGQDSKKHNLNRLSQHPVKFGLQNGHIGSELCANDAEDSVGLNIKRAVLSLIQSSILKESGHGTQLETDVFGVCPTGFEFSKSGGTLTVVRNRDLNKCSQREEVTFPFLSTPYHIQSDVQSNPMISSNFRSEQKINGGIIKSALLEEHYQLRPGGSPDAVVKTNIKTQLTFVNSAPGAIPAACSVPRSILFEQEHSQEGVGVSKRIVDLIKQGCENRAIGRDTAKKFSSLVRAVAGASKTDINNAFQHVKSGPGIKDRPTAQRMLTDAVVLARSGSSVEVLADLLKRKEVSGRTARMYLLSLGAVKHATRSSLVSVLPLLDGEPDINAYLGIGSLVGKYCRDHPCAGVNEVNQLQIKFGAPLLKGCMVGSKKEEDHVIASLKGLGNIRYLGPKIAGKIGECAEDRYVRSRIRVAALETMATDANKEQFKSLALDILKNVDEDSEIRIKAYLVLTKCPCGKVAEAIRDLLSTEQSNQVGGFIVSHLRSLKASTNPDKQAARYHLGNIIPPSRFIIDPRRYSVNQELSYSNGIINSGASGEGNIIYSQNSYIPRSLSLNLTTQIFGTAYNLLEVDVRAENLERIAEHILGPRGYLHTNSFEEILEDGRHDFDHILERIASRYDHVLRPKRSISRDQLNNIAKKVHLPHTSNDIDLDFSLKVLGSEVAWSHFHDSDAEDIDGERVIDESFNTLESLLHSLKNSEVDYRRHLTFYDRELTYPTGLGLALRAKGLGAAALRLKLDGKLDIPAIIRDPRNTDIRFQLIPSAAINFGGEIVIDGVEIETGVRMDLNIHSSTGSDVTFRILDGHGVDVKIGLPLQKQELISLNTEYTSIIRDDHHALTSTPISFDAPRESYSGCFDQLNGAIGLTFCGEISVPWEEGKPLFPFHGPINMAVSIDKEESLTSYHFKAYYDRNEENAHALELLLDTPHCRTNRKIKFDFRGSLSDPKRFLSVGLETPWVSSSLNAHIVNSNQEDSINIKFVNADQEYSARIGAKVVERRGGKVKYEPVFEYKIPEGSRSALVGKKPSSGRSGQSLTTAGHIVVERRQGSMRYVFQQLAFATPRTNYILHGSLSLENDAISSDLKVSYDNEHVLIKGKAHRNDRETVGSIHIAPSQYPDIGISASFESKRTPAGLFEQKIIFVHGPDPKSQVSRLYIHNRLERSQDNEIRINIGNETIGLKRFSFLHEITYPVVQLDLSLEAALSEKEARGGFIGRFDKYSAKLKGAVSRNEKSHGDYQASLDAGLMDQELKFQSSRSVEGPDKSRLTNLLILKPGGTYQLNALVNHRIVNDQDIDLSIEADGSIPNKASIKLSGALKHTAAQCQSKLKIYLGNKCYIDGSAVYNRGNAPNADLKLSIPGYVETDGKLISDGSHSNVVAHLFLPKADRRMEAKADLTVKSPKYAGVISVCYDTKDPRKTFKIQTNNELSYGEEEYLLESRNTISHDDTAIEINGKSRGKGSPLKEVSSSELEVKFPNGYNIGGKYNEKIDLEDANEAEINLELWDQPRGTGKQKLEVRVVGKHIDIEEGTVDGQASLSYLSRDQRNLHIHANAKKVPSSDKQSSNVGLEVGATGSLIDLPSSLKLESVVSNKYFDSDESLSIEDDLPPISFDLSASLGSDLSLEGTGKIGTPSSLQLSGKFPPKSSISNFQFSSVALIDLKVDDSKENGKIKVQNSLHYNGNKFLTALIEGHCEDNGFQYAFEYETDQVSKRRLSGSAHLSVDEELKGDISLKLNANNQVSEISAKGEINEEGTDSSLHISVNAQHWVEGDKVDIILKNKILQEGRGLQSDLLVTQGSKRLNANAKVELDPDHPVLEINIDQPDGKSRLAFKSNKKGERHHTTELKVKWTSDGGGLLSVATDINLESIDNFLISAVVESPQLFEAGKVQYEIANRPAKGEAKKITFLFKENDKAIASGSATYTYREEGDNAVLEGHGTIKIKDQSHPLNFQASSQSINDGQSAKLSATLGKLSLNVQAKSTPDEFSIERTICKEAKSSCSKLQISSKIRTGVESEERSVIVLLDLSLYNPKLHDFSYRSEYKRNNLFWDHNIELQWAKDARIRSKAYVHENSAGLYIDLPKRTVGGEVKYTVQRKENSGSISAKVESELHLNKGKEPKLSFVAGTTSQYDKGALTVAGEAKFSHPSLRKDLIARGQASISDKSNKLIEGLLEIDVSPDSNNKVIGKLKVSKSKDSVQTVASLKSKGCHIDINYEEKVKFILNGRESFYSYQESLSYTDSRNTKREFVAKLEVSPDRRIYGLLKAPDALIEADFNLEKGYSGSLNLFGRKYHDSIAYNKDSRVYTYQLAGLKDGKSLTIQAGGKLGASGSLVASYGDKRACNLNVDLAETNFLKSSYSYDLDVIKNVYAAFINELSQCARDGANSLSALYDRQLSEAKRLLECINKCRPNFGGLVNYIEGQAKQIRQEIANDKTLKGAAEFIKQYTGTTGESIAAIIDEFVKLYKSIAQAIDELAESIIASINNLIPTLKESGQRVLDALQNLIETYLKLSSELLDLLVNEINKHRDDIDLYVKSVLEFLEDIGQEIGQLVITTNAQLEDLIQLNLESLTNTSITAVIQEKLDELKTLEIPEEVSVLIIEVLDTLRELQPTPEATQFVTTLETVVEKILKHQEIKNRDEVLKQLYREFIAAVKSILELLAESAPETGILKPTRIQSLPLNNNIQIPSGSLRFSLLNLLSSDEFLPSLTELLNGLKLSLNPLENIPPYKGHASIIGGTEIITFDGVHLSIPAACSYVLAEDYRDRNFSIVGQISNGALKSLTVSSRDHSVELRPNSNALINGKEHVMPIRVGELKAWRRPTSLGVWSDSGVLVICSHSLDSCFIEVNGFYFGRVRGLLGNLNGEQYDDRLLPEGKIVPQTSDLASGWKLDGSCSIPSTSGHKHNRISECTEIFSEEPLAIFCRAFVNPAPYRDACDHLAARSKTEGACLAAQLYTVACREQGILIADVPDICAKCKINGKTVENGESEQVTQGNTADIVLLVEQSKDNEENYRQIAVPLVNEIKAELAKRGISDVRAFTIGGSPQSEHTSFFTNGNGEIAFDPASNDVWFDERPIDSNETFVDVLKSAYRFVRSELGQTADRQMYEVIFNTPDVFRPNSHRFVIGVHGQPCAPTVGTLLTAFARMIDQELQGVQYSVITPIEDIEKDGKELTSACVISESNAILSGGEKIDGTDYEGLDICVHAALQTGVALSANELQASPQRPQLIRNAASRLVQQATAEKRVMDCECSLWKGVIPYPDCSVSEV